jgi:hypothetical protein
MNPPPPSSERARGLRRWLIPAALLAVAPKCLVCLAAYAGVAAALGLGGAELCGATTEPARWLWLLPVTGTAVAIVTRHRRRA